MTHTRKLRHWRHREPLLFGATGVVLLFVSCGSNDGKRAAFADSGNAGEAGAAVGEGGERSSAGGGAEPPVGRGGGGAAAGDSTTSGTATAGATEIAAGAAGADVGGAPMCNPGTTCSADGVVTVCSAEGSLVSLECTNGCQDDACLPTDLSSGWILRQFPLVDNSQQVLAAYTFSDDGLSALETVNAQPSVYYLDRVLTNVEVMGKFSVETTTDDDLIGFVFGYQDPQHFYLFSWKQESQVDPICGTCEQGATLKLMSSEAALTYCADFWSSSGTAQANVLVPTASNPSGWVDNAVYDFRLLHQPGHIEIEVRQGSTVVVSIQASDDTYPSGKFGFYSYSQEQSRYQFFDIQPKLE
jgi:hypothetical protein